jgi:hypothetical protein
MSRPSRPSLRRSVPWGLLGMIGLVLAIETTLGEHDQPTLSTNVAMSWRFAGRAADSKVRNCEVLCFGDSQVQFAIMPQAIERRLGTPAYNLAIHAGQPTASYFLLRRALESGARPKALVVDFQPNTFGMDPQGQARLFAEMLDPPEALELAAVAHQPGLFAEVALGRLLASYRDRHEIRAGLMHWLDGRDPAKTNNFWFTPLWRNWRVNLGATIYARNPDHDANLPPDHWLAPREWTRHRAPIGFMKRFLDLARDRDIAVFWLLPPVHPVVIAERRRRGLEAPFERFVAEVQSRYPNVVVLDARHVGYGQEVFADIAHLDRDGAGVLSLDVAEALARHIDGRDPSRRWIELPAYRERPIPVRFEDVDESRLALKIVP